VDVVQLDLHFPSTDQRADSAASISEGPS